MAAADLASEDSFDDSEFTDVHSGECPAEPECVPPALVTSASKKDANKRRRDRFWAKKRPSTADHRPASSRSSFLATHSTMSDAEYLARGARNLRTVTSRADGTHGALEPMHSPEPTAVPPSDPELVALVVSLAAQSAKLDADTLVRGGALSPDEPSELPEARPAAVLPEAVEPLTFVESGQGAAQASPLRPMQLTTPPRTARQRARQAREMAELAREAALRI